MTTSTLDSSIFSLDGRRRSLPGVLAHLATASGGHYDAMQAHQAHVWHTFIVQLAVIAMSRGGVARLPTEEAAWRQLLAALTDDPSAWWVEQPDLSRPAFLQPPLPDGAAAFTKQFPTPDAMDVLSTAKNHDVKRFRAVRPALEHWLFTLVTLQTSSGLLGRGNYGVTRMNGGYASRAYVGYYRDLGWAERFREDVQRLLGDGLRTLSDGDRNLSGPALLWTLPWGPSKESLPIRDLHPLFIEVCRRVRCVDGVWHGGTSGSERIGAKSLKGDVGDPWLPITEKGGALNVQASGFDYKLLVELISGRLSLPPYMRSDAAARWLVAAVLAGQQGGTNGYHSRTVAIPAKAASRFATPSERDKLVRRANDYRARADDVRKRCLLPAVLKLFDEDLQHGAGFRPFLLDFDREVDAIFFERLWESLDQDGVEAEASWLQTLGTLGRAVLSRAARSAPRRASSPFKRRAAALSVYDGSFHKNFSSGLPHVA